VQHSSAVHAFANQLKCLIGVGSLTLPYVTAKVGIVLSLVGVLSLCYASWAGILLITYCAAHVRRRQAGGDGLLGTGPCGVDGSKGKGGEDGEGSDLWRAVAVSAFGNTGWSITLGILTLAQVGVASSYVDQTKATIEQINGLKPAVVSLLLWMMLSLFCLAIKPGMRLVAYFSTAALCVYLYLYILLAYFSGPAGQGHRTEPVKYADGLGIGAWYGPALFAFEGMGTAVSIYESMGHTDPKPFMKIATISYIMGGAIYCYVMTVGYLSYGENTRHAVLDNFPQNALGRSANYIICLALVCSYILQMTPIFKIVEEVVMPLLDVPPGHEWVTPFVRSSLRAVIVAITVMLSAIVPDMEKMVALTGAFAFSLLCFVLPGCFYLKLKPDDGGWWERVLAMTLIPLGAIGAFVGVIGVVTDTK